MTTPKAMAQLIETLKSNNEVLRRVSMDQAVPKHARDAVSVRIMRNEAILTEYAEAAEAPATPAKKPKA